MKHHYGTYYGVISNVVNHTTMRVLNQINSLVAQARLLRFCIFLFFCSKKVTRILDIYNKN